MHSFSAKVNLIAPQVSIYMIVYLATYLYYLLFFNRLIKSLLFGTLLAISSSIWRNPRKV